MSEDHYAACRRWFMDKLGESSDKASTSCSRGLSVIGILDLPRAFPRVSLDSIKLQTMNRGVTDSDPTI